MTLGGIVYSLIKAYLISLQNNMEFHCSLKSLINHKILPQVFSSEPSLQSFSPLQKRPRSMQAPSPQARNPSCKHDIVCNNQLTASFTPLSQTPLPPLHTWLTLNKNRVKIGLIRKTSARMNFWKQTICTRRRWTEVNS